MNKKIIIITAFIFYLLLLWNLAESFASTRLAVASGGVTSGDCTVTACTLAWANSQATSGDTVYIANGTYTGSTLQIKQGVIYQGQSEAGTILKLNSPMLNIDSGDGNNGTSCNFELRDFTMDGDESKGWAATLRRCSDFTIHDVTIIEFATGGLNINAWGDADIPVRSNSCGSGTFETGIELYNLTMNQAGDYISGYSQGAITLAGIDGLIIRDSTITEADGDRGTGIKAASSDQGCLKNLQIYNNTITGAPNANGNQFAIELWEVSDDSKIHDNIILGSVDFDHTYKGGGTYALEFYNNTLKYSSQTSGAEDDCLLFDNSNSDVEIYGNHFENCHKGINFNQREDLDPINTRIRIYYNSFYNIDSDNIFTNNDESQGAGSTDFSAIDIFNNVFDVNGQTEYAIVLGVGYDANDTMEVEAKNNIITGATQRPGVCQGSGTYTIDFEKNFYNGNGNNSFYNNCGASLTDSDHITTQGAPEWNGSGNKPSPYYEANASDANIVDVGIDVGLAYEGANPDVGRYEYSAGDSTTANGIVGSGVKF